MKFSRHVSLLATLGLLSLLALSLQAAPIPSLFNTGVDNGGALLAPKAVDPHYKLITSADPNFPGPDAQVILEDFPLAQISGGPWLPNGPTSKWIAPQPDQTCCGQKVGEGTGAGGNEPGDYVYRTTFDLTGFDLSTVKLTGQWAVDSEGTDIKINGTSTGNKIAPFPPQPSESWHPFTIISGFVDGVNTLDFVVNRSSGKYPTGLRAEVAGTGVLFPRVPGLFGTGVDDSGALLAAKAVDPHYKLITSADPAFPGPDAQVILEDFPLAQISGGPWLPNGPTSKWIAPQPDQTCCGQKVGEGTGAGGNEPGDYVYRISFDLTGFDLGTVKISGQWAVDSEGTDIKINGTSTGNKIAPFPPQPSESWHPFTITSGFVDGVNTLDFVVNRSSGKYPTGLRAEVLGTGATAGSGSAAPVFLVQPKSQAVKLGSSASFLASVKGSGLSYQWRLGGNNILGANSARLEIASVKESDLGVYDLLVKNRAGEITSEPASLLLAVAVPGLFNTGRDASGALLADGAVDPHFTLVASADDLFPGPDTLVVLEDAPIAPVGNWVANGPDSRWIAPAANQNTQTDGGNLVGSYTYRITFDLSGLDPATTGLTGNWAVNGAMPDVILNGKSTGLQIGPFEPARALRPFSIDSGFTSGLNTLDFVVSAAGTAGALVATGLRVEIQGITGQLPANTPPTILEQAAPQELVVIEGDPAVFGRVAVRGSLPLGYKWRRVNGPDVPGATGTTLAFASAGASDEGRYELIVSNSAGSVISAPVTLTVLRPLAGFFNVGVGADGKVLADGSVDPHYQLITNANDPQSKDAIVEDSTLYPIVQGPWVANSEVSKWIGPLVDPNGEPGRYVYRTTFDLTGTDPAAVHVMGKWAVDDAGVDIVLNGSSTGLQNTRAFSSFTLFVLTSGFTAGVNTLDFVMNNGGTALNPTGLRVELRAGARRGEPAPNPALGITRAGLDTTISWPASATGFRLFRTGSLTAPNWTEVLQGIVVSGDQNNYKVQGTDPAGFFRLQK